MQRQLQELVGKNMQTLGIFSLELDAKVNSKGAVAP